MKALKIAPITAILLCIGGSVLAQTSIAMNFQGLLKDRDGAHIVSESFDLTVKLMNPEKAASELWMREGEISTDKEGWLSFSVEDIVPFLNEGQATQTLIIWLEFMPNNKTHWLNEGESLMLNYTLTATYKNEGIGLTMKRIEGSDLTYDIDSQLYAFKDEYPYANLTGGFILTDEPPLYDGAVNDLRLWMLPPPSETRGVRGGFPKGGYRKR